MAQGWRDSDGEETLRHGGQRHWSTRMETLACGGEDPGTHELRYSDMRVETCVMGGDRDSEAWGQRHWRQ